MNSSRENPTKIPDEALTLSRQRIAAKQPEMEKLLDDAMKMPADEAMLLLVKEGLVKMTETCKILAMAIHDVRGHQAPFTACQDELCLVNKSQIDAGAGLVAVITELEEKSHGK